MDFSEKGHLRLERFQLCRQVVAECRVGMVVHARPRIVTVHQYVMVQGTGMHQLVDLQSQVACFPRSDAVEQTGEVENHQFGQYCMGLPEGSRHGTQTGIPACLNVLVGW